MNAEETRQLFICLDQTWLREDDAVGDVSAFCRHTNQLCDRVGERVAAVCVYPHRMEEARRALEGAGIGIAVVSGDFPNGSLPTEQKVAQVREVVLLGADEVDVVLNHELIVQGNYDEAMNEVVAMKQVCGERPLKVILETGIYSSLAQVEIAANVAIQGGADFIKTSTGKVGTGATIEAADVMLNCIKKNVKINKKTVGFKAAGGIKDVDEAWKYALLAEKIMGADYVNRQTFRIGASRLADPLAAILTF